MEHFQFAGPLAQMRNALHTCGTRTNNTNLFVFQFFKTTTGITTRIVIVPAAGVKRVSFEAINTRNTRQLGSVQWTISHGHISRAHSVATISAYNPILFFFIPCQVGNFCRHTGIVVKVVVLSNILRMRHDFRRKRIFVLGNVV